MTEEEALAKMIAPGTRRPWKAWGGGGVMQIMVTRACDRDCYGCTQGSNLGGKPVVMTPEQFDLACQSLKGYPYLVGVFGGNPCVHPQFEELCRILRSYFPQEKCGLWSNNLRGHGAVCRRTFRPDMSNLNVHMDRAAFDEMWRDWPEARRFIKGLDRDSRHSPPFVAMRDVVRKQCPGALKDAIAGLHHPISCTLCNGQHTVPDDSRIWEMISNCDINREWSALIGVVPGRGLRGYFCEIAYAQAALHADDPLWPDTGIPIPFEAWQGEGNAHGAWSTTSFAGAVKRSWWQLPMTHFAEQVRLHCHACGIPLRREGELACNPAGKEEVSETHAGIYKPKDRNRKIELVTVGAEKVRTLGKVTEYLANGK